MKPCLNSNSRCSEFNESSARYLQMASLASKLIAEEAADAKRITSNDPAIAVTVMVALAAKLTLLSVF